MGTRVVAIVAALMVAGCSPQRTLFACTDNTSCGGGFCETSGFCSFTDPSCPSGRRFGDLGGPNGQCVDQPPPDAGPDAPPDARVCFGTAPFTVCFTTPPTGAIDVSMATTFNTDTGTVTGTQLNCANPMSGGTGYCVLAANTITINQSLRATGTKPLVLVAVDSISVAMSIDVASHRMGAMDSLGAGADPTTGCNAGTPPGAATGGSGGGAGGSFIGAGGSGGVGGGGGTSGVHGLAISLGTVLHGGCPGQDGAGGGRGARGHGGGAVFLIAGNSITVGGTINAGGEGGEGATATADGGGGGGAGGLIGFDATTITVTGTLIANGGGGGEGSSNQTGNPGSDVSMTTAAPGGTNGSGPGGDGGAGSAGGAGGTGTVGQDGSGGGGGGGGGGGAGLIKGPPASLGTKVSPAATP